MCCVLALALALGVVVTAAAVCYNIHRFLGWVLVAARWTKRRVDIWLEVQGVLTGGTGVLTGGTGCSD